MAKNDFQYGGWNSYTLQCGTITTFISPGDCTLPHGMWLWNRDWIHQVAAPCNVIRGFGMTCHWIRPVVHPTVWHVALESWVMTLNSPGGSTLQYGRWLWDDNAIEFAQMSAILEFYIWFLFRPHYRSRHLHQSPKFYPNRTTLGRKKWRHVDFQDGGSQPSWIFSSWRTGSRHLAYVDSTVAVVSPEYRYSNNMIMLPINYILQLFHTLFS